MKVLMRLNVIFLVRLYCKVLVILYVIIYCIFYKKVDYLGSFCIDILIYIYGFF